MTYYPYFRGRMYDLLALKELCEEKYLGKNIIPIIEPVRDSKELSQTINVLIKNNQPFSVVANPQVGLYGLNNIRIHPLPDLKQFEFYRPSAILSPDFSEEFLVDQKKSLLICSNYELLKAYQDSALLKYVDKILIPDEARSHELIGKKAVLWEDPLTFDYHVENYARLNDEFFEPPIWYQQVDNFNGFSDYSMVGHVYFEKGIPSRAIALHIIYVVEDGTLRIHHFVSDSNETMKGQKEKFFEALKKLADWSEKNIKGINSTPALQELLSYQQQKKFPGLGKLKKLSIKHHLQLINQLFKLKENNNL